MGSSPLARGLPHTAGHEGGLEGIIPARAGFTLQRNVVVFHGLDHPRSRGVYGVKAAGIAMAAGSSPLARGLPRD